MRLDFASFCSQQTACGFSPWTRCQILSQDQTKHEYCIPQAFTQLVPTYKHFPTFVLKSLSLVMNSGVSCLAKRCFINTPYLLINHSLYRVHFMMTKLTSRIKFHCVNIFCMFTCYISSEVPSASSVYL